MPCQHIQGIVDGLQQPVCSYPVDLRLGTTLVRLQAQESPGATLLHLSADQFQLDRFEEEKENEFIISLILLGFVWA